ncbi:Fatty acid synthase subunit beta [Ancistrocladus abbreviatus]
METIWRAVGASPDPQDYAGIEFWSNPERTGWLTKQGAYIPTWRRRWFVLKQGKLFWFKDSFVTRTSVPRGVIPAATCITVKGAEDILHKPFAFQLSTNQHSTMYFIADSEKEKEEWINSIGRSIVQHSGSVTDSEVVDYDSRRCIDFLAPRCELLPVAAVNLCLVDPHNCQVSKAILRESSSSLN